MTPRFLALALARRRFNRGIAQNSPCHRRRTSALRKRPAGVGRILLRVIVAPIRVFWLMLFPAITTVFWRQFLSLAQTPTFWVLAAGFVAGVAIDRIWYRHQELLRVTVHELTHVLVGIFFCYIPIGFKSTRDQGGYAKEIGVGLLPFLGMDCMILAPYYLSTLAAPFVALHPVLPERLKLFVALGAGIGWGIHAIDNIEDFLGQWQLRAADWSFGQRVVTDIEQSGRVFSLLFIPLMWLATNGLAIAVLLGGYAGAGEWASEVWEIAFPTLKAVGAFLSVIFS